MNHATELSFIGDSFIISFLRNLFYSSQKADPVTLQCIHRENKDTFAENARRGWENVIDTFIRPIDIRLVNKKINFMSLERILENWEDYDNKKKKGDDARYFSCSEKWEVDYLTEKIAKLFPNQVRDGIRQAISSCCETVRAPRPRRQFVECVLRRLRLI